MKTLLAVSMVALFLNATAKAASPVADTGQPASFASTSIEIRCEGGLCNSALIEKSLPLLEAHFSAYRAVLGDEAKDQGLSMTEKTFVVIRVLDQSIFNAVVRAHGYADSDFASLFFSADEAVLTAFTKQKGDGSLKTVWAAYIGVLYMRVFHKAPTVEQIFWLAKRATEYGKAVVSVQALQQEH